MTRRRAWTIALGLCLTLCCCVLVPSIDDVQPSRSETCETCHDAAVDASNDAGDAAPQPDSSHPEQRDAGMDSGKARGCEVPTRTDCQPYDPCPTVRDGICDEQSGTKTCADGTDAEDCNCHRKLPGAPCDPVSQCGCDRSLTCEVLYVDDTRINGVPNYTARCTRPGMGKPHDSCSATSDCERGSFCNRQLGMCTKYCWTDVGCEGDDDCIWLWNNADPKLGQCRVACDRQTGKPCRAGSVCAYWAENYGGFASKAGNYCSKPVSEAECPHGNECDEPEGTGLCLPGADRVDCCKPPTAGGVCDPVNQCGCEDMQNTQCQHRGDSAVTSCQPRGTQALYSRCSSEQAQCGPGSSCIDGVCRPYCHSDVETDCGSGNLCVSLDDDWKDLGACFVACDFMGQNTCPEGLVCQRIVGTSAVCNRVYPVCDATVRGDKKCDDTRPMGSRICELGGDPEDCGPVP